MLSQYKCCLFHSLAIWLLDYECTSQLFDCLWLKTLNSLGMRIPIKDCWCYQLSGKLIKSIYKQSILNNRIILDYEWEYLNELFSDVCVYAVASCNFTSMPLAREMLEHPKLDFQTTFSFKSVEGMHALLLQRTIAVTFFLSFWILYSIRCSASATYSCIAARVISHIDKIRGTVLNTVDVSSSLSEQKCCSMGYAADPPTSTFK